MFLASTGAAPDDAFQHIRDDIGEDANNGITKMLQHIAGNAPSQEAVDQQVNQEARSTYQEMVLNGGMYIGSWVVMLLFV